MTIDEKLQHFMDVTTEKVNAENAKQMQEYEQGLEKVYEDYKETALRKSELALKLKEESLKKQMNADLAAEQITIREQTGKLLRELDEKLSSEVKGKLERYMATSAYETYCIRVTILVNVRIFHNSDEQYRLLTLFWLSLLRWKIARPLGERKDLFNLLLRFHNNIAERLPVSRTRRVARCLQHLRDYLIRYCCLLETAVGSVRSY